MIPSNVLFVSSEVDPFSKTGGLADVSGSLPAALKSLGCEVKVFSPFYRHVKKGGFNTGVIKSDIPVTLDRKIFRFSLHYLVRDGVDFYFIGNDRLFDRDQLYGSVLGDYRDNALRFAFFDAAVLESARVLDYRPGVIHCNDWHTGLIPFYVRNDPAFSGFFGRTRTLFTIHNLMYQGLFPRRVMPRINVGKDFFTADKLEFYGRFSFMKSGIIFADAVSTVSAGYAREILTREFGCGLDGLLSTRKIDLYGIPNGVDYSKWSPDTDRYIKVNYDAGTLEKKKECKLDLLKIAGLPEDPDTPLLGVVSRLAEQKGMDIVAAAAADIVGMGYRMVVLGKGEARYEKSLTGIGRQYQGNIVVDISFNNQLAHKIEAGCDMFLMPSRYEPCGLNQMFSLKYGTIPVVRAVGGLEDTVIDFNDDAEYGNGFKFRGTEARDLSDTLRRALPVYRNSQAWEKITRNAMACDFSWIKSARQYVILYSKLSGAVR
ncbi:MAG: glycogen synthase GlgA [Candidatus Omnitrophota bacterium]